MLRWALGLLTGLVATASTAQLSATASVTSDYRVRGVTLSEGRPAAQLDASYDDELGWFAGAFASNVQFYEHSDREAQLMGYAGYARRLGGGWSVDAGAAYSTFSGGNGYNYVELHAGVTSDVLSARLYYAPDYFGQGIHTLYAELNGSQRLFDRVKLIGHAGVLQLTAGATSDTGGHGPHADFLAGVEVEVKRFRLQVSRIAADGASRAYPVGSGHPAGVWVARISAGF